MNDRQVVRSPDAGRECRIPPGQRATEDWPVLHWGNVPALDLSKWTFTISGLVEHEVRLDYQQFMALPRVAVHSDVHCVTGWSKLDNLWEGVSTTAIEELTNVLPEAKFVVVHSVGGFTTNLPRSDFFAEDALFAISHNGSPLTPEHGHPVRLVVPRLYFWKSAKWVIGVEFVWQDQPGFWESRGYHNHGDPWKEERLGE